MEGEDNEKEMEVEEDEEDNEMEEEEEEGKEEEEEDGEEENKCGMLDRLLDTQPANEEALLGNAGEDPYADVKCLKGEVTWCCSEHLLIWQFWMLDVHH